MKWAVVMRNPLGLSLYFSYGDKGVLIECIRRRSKAVGLANFVGITRTLLVCVRTVTYCFGCIAAILKRTSCGTVGTELLLGAKTQSDSRT